MENVDIKSQTMKLTFLEVNPPINELAKNKEEINIIFQGHDNFYDLKRHLSTKIPISLNRYKKTIMMTLLKSNNIMATGLFTVRAGEQNVIFNYEDKKKNILKKAVNINKLIDCIKIKILCEFGNYICKNKSINLLYSSNNHINIKDTKNNDNDKYIPKVNLMKSKHLKNKNSIIGKNIFEKKTKCLGSIYINNSIKKYSTNLINSSHDFCVGGEYSTYLTEEQNISNKPNNNLNINEIKKLNN